MKRLVTGTALLHQKSISSEIRRQKAIPIRPATARSMKRFALHSLALSLIVGTLCVVAIAVGRLDRTPSPLQAAGLDLCADEPCFRGIKPGMDWATFQQKFPEATTKDHGELGWITDM